MFRWKREALVPLRELPFLGIALSERSPRFATCESMGAVLIVISTSKRQRGSTMDYYVVLGIAEDGRRDDSQRFRALARRYRPDVGWL
jgi:hypothetical protein